MRCIHCGSFTGETIADVSETANQHGVGICVSPCHYCNEGVLHAPHVCGNVVEGQPYPPRVQDFLDRR